MYNIIMHALLVVLSLKVTVFIMYYL